MSQRDTLLVELRTEELPPKSLKRLGEAFLEHLLKSLVDSGFADAGAGPRLLAPPPRRAGGGGPPGGTPPPPRRKREKKSV